MYHSNLYCYLNSEILLKMSEGNLTMYFDGLLLQLPSSAWTLGKDTLQKATRMAKEQSRCKDVSLGCKTISCQKNQASPALKKDYTFVLREEVQALPQRLTRLLEETKVLQNTRKPSGV